MEQKCGLVKEKISNGEATAWHELSPHAEDMLGDAPGAQQVFLELYNERDWRIAG
jgi:hypothetical protein